MRDMESMDLAYGLLLGIRSFVFRLPLHKTELNRWDKETLILAGLIGESDRPQFSAPPESKKDSFCIENLMLLSLSLFYFLFIDVNLFFQ